MSPATCSSKWLPGNRVVFSVLGLCALLPEGVTSSGATMASTGKRFLGLCLWDFQRLSSKVCIQTFLFPKLQGGPELIFKNINCWYCSISLQVHHLPGVLQITQVLIQRCCPFVFQLEVYGHALYTLRVEVPLCINRHTGWDPETDPETYEISKTELKSCVWKLPKVKVPLLRSSTSTLPSDKRNCWWNPIYWCKEKKNKKPELFQPALTENTSSNLSQTERSTASSWARRRWFGDFSYTIETRPVTQSPPARVSCSQCCKCISTLSSDWHTVQWDLKISCFWAISRNVYTCLYK